MRAVVLLLVALSAACWADDPALVDRLGETHAGDAADYIVTTEAKVRYAAAAVKNTDTHESTVYLLKENHGHWWFVARSAHHQSQLPDIDALARQAHFPETVCVQLAQIGDESVTTSVDYIPEVTPAEHPQWASLHEALLQYHWLPSGVVTDYIIVDFMGDSFANVRYTGGASRLYRMHAGAWAPLASSSVPPKVQPYLSQLGNPQSTFEYLP